MAPSRTLTLAEAVKSGRVDDFASQQEAAGIGAVDEADFEDAVRRIVKPPQSPDRTSRSASRGGSSGK
jgi:hypothetical protein